MRELSTQTLTVADVRRLLELRERGNWSLIERVKLSQASARALLANIEDVVRHQRLDVRQAEVKDERQFGLANLAFLTTLHNLNLKACSGTTQDRVATARHIFTAAEQGSCVTLDDLMAYRAHAVFGFGPRQFDTLFESGDGAQVKGALLNLALDSPAVAQCCREVGWGAELDLRLQSDAEQSMPERVRA